jgi:hypothetical protein
MSHVAVGMSPALSTISNCSLLHKREELVGCDRSILLATVVLGKKARGLGFLVVLSRRCIAKPSMGPSEELFQIDD